MAVEDRALLQLFGNGACYLTWTLREHEVGGTEAALLMA